MSRLTNRLMTRREALAGLLAVAALPLAACGPAAGGEARPPEISYGLDMCAECGMLISDDAFAAATAAGGGAANRFDDAGCMLSYHARRPGEPAAAWFVHDYQSRGWLRAEQAAFVHSPALASPMGYNLAAFGDRSAAEAFAAGQADARLMTFDELRAAPPTRGGH
jgi:copper chaperone NosL